MASLTLGRGLRGLVSRCSSLMSRSRSAGIAAALSCSTRSRVRNCAYCCSLSDSASCACITSIASNSCWSWNGVISATAPRGGSARRPGLGGRGPERAPRARRPRQDTQPDAARGIVTSLPARVSSCCEQPHEFHLLGRVRCDRRQLGAAWRPTMPRLDAPLDVERSDQIRGERPRRFDAAPRPAPQHPSIDGGRLTGSDASRASAGRRATPRSPSATTSSASAASGASTGHANHGCRRAPAPARSAMPRGRAPKVIPEQRRRLRHVDARARRHVAAVAHLVAARRARVDVRLARRVERARRARRPVRRWSGGSWLALQDLPQVRQRVKEVRLDRADRAAEDAAISWCGSS